MSFFENDIKDESTGKNIDSLVKSREIRRNFIEELGEFPTSILINNRQDRAIDLAKNNERSYEQTVAKRIKKSKLLTKDEFKHINSKDVIRAFGTSYKTALEKHNIKGALSAFPQNVGRLLVKFYCPENGTFYDPFAGHNSRMQLTYEAKRNYVGVDISKQFMIHNHQIKNILMNRGLLRSENTITLIEGSSAKTNLPDNFADFTITSPPYWDIEYYGDEPEQLGKAKTYDKFLELITDHIVENFRLLKPGSFCCWNVNDFIKNGIYHTYHADLIPIFKSAGFLLHTIYIIDLGLPVQAAFAQAIIKTKRFPKRHEYILTFKKP